ncbi:myotrophin [Contarinia nasturtii]|uniref:myotrophin n=1 Tax=Contarinia nasturtii TaxID=265458 RepID=UPI0012D3FD08|nr:myotrophin [Contarinia nasturtii]XP_031630465.1 myotrophin [Contarinia nasturtii]
MAQIDDSIIWAIKNGDLDQVKELIEQNGFNVNQQITTRAPIHYAADYGQSDVLRYLINKGADVNTRDKHGITPILAATWEGHTNCVRILLENGADKSITTPDGTSLIDAAEKQEVRDLLS